MPFILPLSADNKYPSVGEIPALTAKAIYPESDNEPEAQGWARAACQMNHEADLDRAIKSGMVTPLNPLSYAPHTFPFGDALRNAVISLDDFKQFAASLQIEVVIWAGKVDAKKEKIRVILDKIEAADGGFSRDAMPGRKADFFNLCKKLEHESFAYITQATFNDYLLGLCKFMSGARETDYYRDIAAKLG